MVSSIDHSWDRSFEETHWFTRKESIWTQIGKGEEIIL